ncbi:AAA family ATPase [Synechococcus sp. PCC 6312]|uniref:AAA family ATPase n=1 Tax=Synechococcus sp. (strain ATCC 27167 / PCC 6312) TaxID=195253 RepID=UPI00029F0285|nr:AAA family ATPase [Synechococcus sp. PCC 6312]AFY61923.1 hypothetical protein Syn6312_2859 [Synechococcus sp. PCC 6312]
MLLILRGLPGAGKTTLAKLLTKHECSADDFPNLYQNGQLQKILVPASHAWCQQSIKEYLELYDNEEIIAVHNTFCQNWEIKPYIEMAQKYGHDFSVVTVEGNYGSIHNVPPEVMESMKERWESFSLDVINAETPC